jgi:hypothetical protein
MEIPLIHWNIWQCFLSTDFPLISAWNYRNVTPSTNHRHTLVTTSKHGSMSSRNKVMWELYYKYIVIVAWIQIFWDNVCHLILFNCILINWAESCCCTSVIHNYKNVRWGQELAEDNTWCNGPGTDFEVTFMFGEHDIKIYSGDFLRLIKE